MFNFLLQLITDPFKRTYDTGVLPDLRPEEEKQKDWLHEEVTADAALAVYRTKADILPQTQKYFKENQFQTLSCVAHSSTLALGIDNEFEGHDYVRLSKNFFYRLRKNYPNGGMIGVDAGTIGSKYGSCLYDDAPTSYNEYGANNFVATQKMKDDALNYRAQNFVSIANYNDIDTLASVASQGKGIVIILYMSKREYTEYPKIIDSVTYETAPIRHSVCILPEANFIENGVKYVTVQDSAPFNGFNIRFISEDFIKQRCYFALYYLNLQNPNPTPMAKPVHTFTQTMKYGDNNDEVKWLQKCLAYEGIHPDGATTGYFGGLTLNSVKQFQTKYAKEILTPAGISVPSGVVGNFTLAELNKLYSK